MIFVINFTLLQTMHILQQMKHFSSRDKGITNWVHLKKKSLNDIHEKGARQFAFNYNANISLALLRGDQVESIGSIL